MITSEEPSLQDFNIRGVKHITPENAFSALEGGEAIIVDVREDDEYMVDYIPLKNVFHFPMSSIMDKMKQIPDNKSIIALCRRGVRSTKVANLLNRNGFIKAVNLDGGLIAWKSKKLPYETILPDACNSCSGSCSCS